MFDEKNRYVIENYQIRPPFSSFLPGIAGPLEIRLPRVACDFRDCPQNKLF